MKSSGIRSKNAGCSQLVIKGILLLVFLYLFRYEIKLFWSLISAALNILLDQPATGLPPADELLLQLMFIALNIAGSLLLALLIVYLIGGAVLPVRTGEDQWKAMQLFTRFLRGSWAPLLRVREGLLVKEPNLKKDAVGGAAIVDLNSVTTAPAIKINSPSCATAT